MPKETIAVDIDEVLFPFVPNFVDYHNRLNGTSITADDFRTYRFEDDLGVSLEESIEHVYSFNAADHSQIAPLEGTAEAITRLSERFNLNLVTARHPQFETNTLGWIDRHFPETFDSVTFIGYAAIMETPRTKAEICHEIGAIALIDDSPGHVNQCVEEGIQGILFGEYPWNRDCSLANGVVRCGSWTDVEEYFGARS